MPEVRKNKVYYTRIIISITRITMTKEEMLKKYSPNYFENNYAVAQKKIMEAMLIIEDRKSVV